MDKYKYKKTKEKCCEKQKDKWIENRGFLDREFFMKKYKKMSGLLDVISIDDAKFVLKERLNMFNKMVEVAELDEGHDLGMDDFQVRRVVDGKKWWSSYQIDEYPRKCLWIAAMGPGAIEIKDVVNTQIPLCILYIGKDVTSLSFKTEGLLPRLEQVLFHPESECETIQEEAFSGVDTLEVINLPLKLKELKPRTFKECQLFTIDIPNSVTSIGDECFKQCTNLRTAFIGKNVKSIDQEAFSGCDEIETIIIPDSVKVIGDEAFYGCVKLKKLFIGNSVETIGNSAFYGLNQIETINIPDSVKRIEAEAFTMSEDGYMGGFLTKVTGMKNVEVLSYKAFKDQRGLTSISLSDKLKKIGEQCLANTGIESLTLYYNNDLIIHPTAFDWCDKLDYVTLVGGGLEEWTTKLQEGTFSGCDLLIKKAKQKGYTNLIEYVLTLVTATIHN